MKKKIGVIGFGNMGSAIAQRLKSDYKIIVFDKDESKTKDLSGVNAAKTIEDLIGVAQTIILAVKPQDFDNALDKIKDSVKEQLVISIAAGIKTEYIESRLEGKARVIRVMPNMPAKVGEGMTCLSKGRFADDDDLIFAGKLFDHLGETLIINEEMMDAATAVSGSGPGYLYDLIDGKNEGEIEEFVKNSFIPSLTASAEMIGFPHKEAAILAAVTGRGGLIFLKKTKSSPSELKKQVVSKGGTTEAGLKILHEGGSLEEAVKAALKRSKELSKK